MDRSSGGTSWAVCSMITIVAQRSAGMPRTDFSHRTAAIIQPASLHIFEDVLQFLFELKAVIMLSSNDAGRGNNRAVLVGYWQDIAGFGFLAALIADAFAPFLAALWLPSRLSSDKCSSPRMEIMPAAKRRCRLPSLLHLRK